MDAGRVVCGDALFGMNTNNLAPMIINYVVVDGTVLEIKELGGKKQKTEVKMVINLGYKAYSYLYVVFYGVKMQSVTGLMHPGSRILVQGKIRSFTSRGHILGSPYVQAESIRFLNKSIDFIHDELDKEEERRKDGKKRLEGLAPVFDPKDEEIAELDPEMEQYLDL